MSCCKLEIASPVCYFAFPKECMDVNISKFIANNKEKTDTHVHIFTPPLEPMLEVCFVIHRTGAVHK
jgi:hypothetical protein